MLTTHQMASPMYVLRNSVPWIAVLVPPSLLFAIFSGHGGLSVSITSLALLLITPMFLVIMKKPVTEEAKEVADEAVMVEEKADEEDEDSENESVSCFSEEDSDGDWPFSGNNSGHSPHCSSDCSISDEESLIELALPSGHFLGLEKPADPKLQQNIGGVDLFAEINEEDNMIEIDISMGSIKCSRFEIIDEA